MPFELKNTYIVIEDKLFAGSNPVSINRIRTKKNLLELYKNDIEVFINLTERSFFEKLCLINYEKEITEFYNSLNKKVEIYRFGIKDFMIPEKEYMIKILNKIDECLKENKKIYIHCIGGVGRTGTVIGCFLVRKGIVTNSEALFYLKNLRKNLTKESPETSKQKQMIKMWQTDL